jgi:hypothetical protein
LSRREEKWMAQHRVGSVGKGENTNQAGREQAAFRAGQGPQVRE